MNDLSFLVSAFILAYGRTFDTTVIPRIWETLVANQTPYLFLRYFSAALLILSFPSFLSLDNCSMGKLVTQMGSIFKEQNVGDLIGMTLSLMKRSEAEIQTKVKIVDRKPLTVFEVDAAARWLFSVDTNYSDAYVQLGPLFL
jgi:hypothetical protein